MKHVVIHTDGACKGNPGRGAFAAVLVFGKFRKEISAAFRHTTNNRMELLAAIAALEVLVEPCSIDLYSDSQYLIKAINSNWLSSWKRKGWKTSNQATVKNKDLWLRLDAALAMHQLTFHWVKGHAGNRENERCDELANLAISNGPFAEDLGFNP